MRRLGVTAEGLKAVEGLVSSLGEGVQNAADITQVRVFGAAA